MTTAKTASKELAKALANLAKKHAKYAPLAPLDRMILSIIGNGRDGKEFREAIGRIKESFVDWNEVRVARLAEVARCFDPLDGADELAKRVREFLNRLFDLRGSMDLLFLGEIKPSEGKRYLVDLDTDIPRAIISSVLFELCPGVTIPISPEGLKEARKLKIVGRTGTKQQLQKALQSELTPEEAAHMVEYLELEANGGKPVNSAPAKKKTTQKRK